MKLIFLAALSVALGVSADKTYYVEELDATFVEHKDTGIANIQSGHLFDAPTVQSN